MTSSSGVAREPSACVVVPIPTRDRLSSEEELSLRHLDEFLGSHDRCFICAEGFQAGFLDRPGYSVRGFERSFFGSAQAHNRLLLSSDFYERFSDYDFILIYHLDSLVFSDQLGHWCRAGFDFIGPPWIEGPDLPWVEGEGVGNGGFSLRKVSSFQRVLASNLRIDPLAWRKRRVDTLTRVKGTAKRLLQRERREPVFLRTVGEQIRYYLEKGWNEDGFWSRYAPCYDPEFRVAPVEVALRFAFEANPRRCFERTDHTFPFGCHAWETYDRAFWEPLLLEA